MGFGVIEAGLLETPHCLGVGGVLFGAGMYVDEIGKDLIINGWKGTDTDNERTKDQKN